MRHIVNVRKSVQTTPFHPVPRSIPAHVAIPDLDPTKTMGPTIGFATRPRNGRLRPPDGTLYQPRFRLAKALHARIYHGLRPSPSQRHTPLAYTLTALHR